MEEDHFSKEFDDAPMPHSIFFTKIGHAIHGTNSEGRLGTPVSHGCVRLSRANASTLYALVEKDGVLNTTVTLTGSSQIALARNPRARGQHRGGAPRPGQFIRTAIQRRRRSRRADPAAARPRPVYAAGAGRRRLHLSGRWQPGPDRYPAPRGSRRLYGSQAYQQPQPYYDNRGYGSQDEPQVYAPRPYYQPRGLFGYQQ